MALLGSQMGADSPNAAVIETIRKNLNGCKRPGAVWLLTWSRLSSEPNAVMSEWSNLTNSERELLGRAPVETSQEIVAGLTRFQIAQLKKLGKADEAMTAIRRLVELERGNPESLAELLDWLTEQKAWKAVDDLAQRFPPLCHRARPALCARPGVCRPGAEGPGRGYGRAALSTSTPASKGRNCRTIRWWPSDCANEGNSPGPGGSSSTSSNAPATAKMTS